MLFHSAKKGRALLCAFAMLLGFLVLSRPSFAQSQKQPPSMSSLPNPAPMPDNDEERIQQLVLAYHILTSQGIIDGWGHVSVRSAKNPSHYYIARQMAPALVTKDDIYECDENSKPLKPGADLVGERFIHGEVYRARPDVQAVVHSHAHSVIPFGVTGVALRPIMHMAGFLPQVVPIFDSRTVTGDDNGILVKSIPEGAALAKALGNSSVVLMRGHGMTIAAPTMKTGVFRAIYTEADAEIELQSLALGKSITFLNEIEAARVNATNESSVKAWDYWVAQAELASETLRQGMSKTNSTVVGK